MKFSRSIFVFAVFLLIGGLFTLPTLSKENLIPECGTEGPINSRLIELNRRSINDICCNLTSGTECCNDITTTCCQASTTRNSKCCSIGASCCEDGTGVMACCSAGSSCCGTACCLDTSTCCDSNTCCPEGTECCDGACCSDTCFYDSTCINTFGLSKNAFIGVFAAVAAVLVLMILIMLYCCCCADNSPRKRKGREKKSNYEMGTLASPRTQQQAQPLQPTTSTQVIVVSAPPTTSTQTFQNPTPVPAAIITTTSASGNPSAENNNEAILRALQSVSQAVVITLMGIATEKITVDDGITLLAVAATNALQSCQCKSESEFQHNAVIVFNFMDGMFRERIPSLTQEKREGFIKIIVQRMIELAQQGKKQKLEEALELIKNSVIIAWHGFMSNSISLEDAQLLMATGVAAALRNCVITSNEDLKAHLAGFNQWMMMVADECAPSISREVKIDIIKNVWISVAALF